MNQLILDELHRLGLTGISTYTDRAATVPGFFRPAKSWDLLVVGAREEGSRPLLVVEYKSMTGSEGKNLNNRADEVIGVAEDLRHAQDAGLIDANLHRAYIFIMEVTPEVQQPVRVSVRAGSPDPVFQGASYLERMAIMCERLRDSGLYDLAWAVGVVRHPTIDFVEPPSSRWLGSPRLRSPQLPGAWPVTRARSVPGCSPH